MSVKAATPSPAAASPSHPDHARWVKERTLAQEIEHAKIVGGTLRDAEDANRVSLDRLAVRQRKPKPIVVTKRRAETEVTRKELIEAGVTKKAARIIPVQPMACRNCGLCLECKRLARLAEIRRREMLGETAMAPFVNTIRMTALAHGLRRPLRDAGTVFPFDSPSERVRLRAYNAMIDRVCDRTTGIIGEWR